MAWLSFPPEELMATRAPRRASFRHSGGMGILVADMVSIPVWMARFG